MVKLLQAVVISMLEFLFWFGLAAFISWIADYRPETWITNYSIVAVWFIGIGALAEKPITALVNLVSSKCR